MSADRELALGNRSLRAHAARGALVNGAFNVAVSSLGLVRGFVVAAFLTADDYGVWGIVVIAFGTLSWLKQVGVSEKYVQQSEPDQELAFQRAFTIELLANAAFLVVLLVAIPIAVVVYGQDEIVGPALLLALVIPAYVLQTPIWIFYRRMDFVRQRALQAIDPVVSFVVTVGLAIAGAGAITLATTIAQYVDRLDELLSATLYPAICAVSDRVDLLYESFVKANRLALMWGVPFGIGVALFAGDLVHHVIGDHWAFAITLMELTAIAATVHHIGFNWHAYFRARNETRPLAVASVVTVVGFAAGPIPLLLTHGLTGYGAGLVAVAALQLLVRAFFLVRLFEGFRMARHAVRALAPSLVPTALILGWRAAGLVDRTAGEALAEAIVYVALTIAGTLALEGPLLREALAYLRRSQV